METFLLVVGGIMGVWAIYWILKGNEKDKRYSEEQKKRLDDDRIYDEYSGKFLTLEELESGAAVEMRDVNAKYSEDELTRVYHQNNTFPLLHNALIDHRFYCVDDASYLKGFFDNHMVKAYGYNESFRAYRNEELGSICLGEFVPENGSMFQPDTLLFGIFEMSKSCGNYLLRRKESRLNIGRLLVRDEVRETIGEWEVFSEDDFIDTVFLRKLVEAMTTRKEADLSDLDQKQYFDTTIEVKDKLVIFLLRENIDKKWVLPISAVLKDWTRSIG